LKLRRPPKLRSKGRIARRLGAVRCTGCAEALLVFEDVEKIRCARCDRDVPVPRALRDDVDFLVRLDFDPDAEAIRAITAQTRARHHSPEAPRIFLLLLALLGALLMAYALPISSRGQWGIASSFALGFVLTLLPLGFTAQWLQTAYDTRAIRRALRRVLDAPSSCPRCTKDIQQLPSGAAGPNLPGIFRCPGCKRMLLRIEGLIVEHGDAKERAERLASRAGALLEGESWLEQRRMSLQDLLVLLLVGAALLGLFALILLYER